MKILLTAGVFPPEIGGPATYVPRMAVALAARGHAITVVAPTSWGVACPIIDPPYRLVRFGHPSVARYANFAIELGRGLATVAREARGSHLVFANGLEIPAAAANRWLGTPLVVKVVGDFAWELAHGRGWTTRSLNDFQSEPGVLLKALRSAYHAAAQRAATVIAPSRYLAGIVERWGIPPARIRVIPNAVERPASPPALAEPPAVPSAFDDGFRILTIGRLVPHKRIGGIIEAVAGLPSARLVVAGDGPMRAALEAEARARGIADRVHFTGQLPPSSVAGLLARYADCLVLNSTYEGLPHVLLEAAHFGVAIVATAVGGTPEVVRDGESALLIEPEARGALERALETLAGDPRLRERLATGARRVLDRFDFERMVAETERVLLEAGR